MATHYCAHADISAFLQVDAFADGGSATTPTQAQVETFINIAEEFVFPNIRDEFKTTSLHYGYWAMAFLMVVLKSHHFQVGY